MTNSYDPATAGYQAGSSLVGILAANAQSKKSYKYAKKLQAQAAKLNYQYGLMSLENSPSSQRIGLESAGYNPMLAVQNSTQGANSSWTSPTKADVADLSSAMSSSISNAQSFQRLKNETNQAESVADANYATADKAKAEKAEITARLPFVSKRQKAEIAQIEADAQLLEAKKHYLSEDIAVRQAGVNVQQEANAISAIGKEEYSDRAKRYKEWGKKHPYLRNIDETITRYFNGIGANVGANKKVK